MFYVYILRCADESLYVGHTRNIKKRVDAHNAGRGAVYTYNRRPVTLEYTERHETRDAAIQRERQLKHWSRAKKQALIKGDFARLRRLSKRRE